MVQGFHALGTLILDCVFLRIVFNIGSLDVSPAWQLPLRQETPKYNCCEMTPQLIFTFSYKESRVFMHALSTAFAGLHATALDHRSTLFHRHLKKQLLVCVCGEWRQNLLRPPLPSLGFCLCTGSFSSEAAQVF